MANIHALLDDLNPINDRIDGLGTGFQGTIKIADTKTEEGIYIPTEAGVYPNAGGLEYAPEGDDEGYLVQFIFDGSEWVKNTVTLPAQDLSGLATKEEIYPIKYITIPSLNEIAPKSLSGFTWNGTTGTSSFNSNRVSTFKIRVKPNTSYVIKGLGESVNGETRAVFFDENNIFLPSETIFASGTPAPRQYVFTTGPATHFAGFNLANVAGGGNDPQNSAVANTVMLAQSTDINIPYEPYSPKIDESNIKGINAIKDSIENVNAKADLNTDKTNGLLSAFLEYSHFNGVSSSVPLGELFTLNDAGDYIEFEFRTGKSYTSGNGGYSMFGAGRTDASNIFGFRSLNSLSLRTSTGGAYIYFDNLPKLDVFNIIKLAVSNDGTSWELYINGIVVGNAPKIASLIIDNIGAAYPNRAPFDLKYIKIQTQSKTLEIQEIFNDSRAINVEYIVEPKSEEKEEEAILSPVYVSYDPAGYEGRPKFTAFVQRKGVNSFLGIEVIHYYDMSELKYSDQYRISRASEYSFDGTNMILTGTGSIIPGESEFVWREGGIDMGNPYNKADATGGVHGDEILSRVDFYINNIRLDEEDLSTAFSLVPAFEFSYIQFSNMHETANIIDGVPVVVPEHPIQSEHIKHTRISEHGYKTYNKHIWKRPLKIDHTYYGISCIGKSNATFARNENFEETGLTPNDGGELLRRTGLREFYLSNKATGFSCFVTSRLLKPESLDKDCSVFISNRPSDSKYYRRRTKYEVAIGDVEECEMEVRFYGKD